MNLRTTDLPEIPIAHRFSRRSPLFSLAALIFGGAFMFAPAIHAQSTLEPPSLSLDEAVQLTLKQHPRLNVFVNKREAYQGLIDQAGAGQRPEIGFRVEDFAGTDDISGFDSAETTLSISWVMQGARIDSRVQSAQLAASQVDIQRNIEALDLSARTARLFIQAMVEEQRLNLAREAVEQARKTVADIGKRVTAGKSPEFEQLQAEVELAQRELEAEDLQHELTSARHQLSAQWGQARKEYRLVGELFRMPVIDDIDRQYEQLKQNPALSLLATQQRVVQSEIELARIEARPQWQFSVGVRRFETTNDFGMVAGFSVPLGRDRSSVGKIRQLTARQAEYESESEAIALQLDTQLYVLLQEIKHSQHVIETLQERIIPALNSAQAQATQAYETGKLGYQQWAVIVNKSLGAQQDLLRAFEAIHLQHVELQRLTGSTLFFQTTPLP